MSTQQPPEPWDDTIDLRKWIDALVRRWWLVAGFSAAAVIAALAVGYGFHDPAYRSSAGATLPAGVNLSGTGLYGVIPGADQPPASPAGSNPAGIGLTSRGYLEFAGSTPVMEAIGEDLDLEMSAGELRNHYTFRIENDNFITVTATAHSPQQAYRLAGAWIEAYDRQVQQLLQRDFAQRKAALELRKDPVSRERAAAEERLMEFDLDSPAAGVRPHLEALESGLSRSKQRLQDLRLHALPDLESRLASLQDSLIDQGGAVGGGGAPTSPQGPVPSGLGALVPNDEITANPAWYDLGRSQRMAQLSRLETDLLESNSRLRDLTLSSIPLARARIDSLEQALADTPGVPGAGAALPDPLYVSLGQGLVEARVDLRVMLREAEILGEKAAILERRTEEARAELVAFQVATQNLRSQVAARQDMEQLERDLTARRAEARRLEGIIPVLEEEARQLRRQDRTATAARRDLESQVSRLSREHTRLTDQQDVLLAAEPSLPLASSLSTIREPAMPTAPVSATMSRNAVLAGVLGLMIGAAAALFWDYYRPQPAARRPDPE